MIIRFRDFSDDKLILRVYKQTYIACDKKKKRPNKTLLCRSESLICEQKHSYNQTTYTNTKLHGPHKYKLISTLNGRRKPHIQTYVGV